MHGSYFTYNRGDLRAYVAQKISASVGEIGDKAILYAECEYCIVCEYQLKAHAFKLSQKKDESLTLAMLICGTAIPLFPFFICIVIEFCLFLKI